MQSGVKAGENKNTWREREKERRKEVFGREPARRKGREKGSGSKDATGRTKKRGRSCRYRNERRIMARKKGEPVKPERRTVAVGEARGGWVGLVFVREREREKRKRYCVSRGMERGMEEEEEEDGRRRW
ncbi:hypothetical protein K0M31_000702 [Melipona bicolor]|uniref:Uncharacterized protein n=1 Tax=Melipona bicolor TaxID=60889 RepID=A0AA40GFA2_9HYME|nr:hypothetical protein K0M31_000702 [Melipona bicolor]